LRFDVVGVPLCGNRDYPTITINQVLFNYILYPINFILKYSNLLFPYKF